jgi:hypothetical protein
MEIVSKVFIMCKILTNDAKFGTTSQMNRTVFLSPQILQIDTVE